MNPFKKAFGLKINAVTLGFILKLFDIQQKEYLQNLILSNKRWKTAEDFVGFFLRQLQHFSMKQREKKGRMIRSDSFEKELEILSKGSTQKKGEVLKELVWGKKELNFL